VRRSYKRDLRGEVPVLKRQPGYKRSAADPADRQARRRVARATTCHVLSHAAANCGTWREGVGCLRGR